MKPILYTPGETEYKSNGLGPLSEAQSCKVEEARNGAFELTMEYPITGTLFEDVKAGAIILAKPNETAQPQPFRIYKVEKPLSGITTVRAKHISYQLSHIPAAPFSARSCQAALQGLKANAAEHCPFEFWTDKETAAEFSVAEPASIRSLLGGVQGSVLDCYGGEYEFDRYTVKLHKARGQDSGVVIAYGKNLTDLNQEESIENTITGIYPYYKDSDGNILTLPEKVVSSPSAANFPYPRTVPLDCSQEWEGMPTVEQLRTYAQSYLNGENIGVPSVSLKVSFVALWQTEEYKSIAPVERLSLCDMATVRFVKLGVDAKAKVVSYAYDVLAGRYESVTLGEASTNLADKIVAQADELKRKTSDSYLEKAAERATAWITGNKGGYVLLRKNADGQPYEILIMDAPEIENALKVWRWNSGGLGYSENGYNGHYKTAITQGGEIVADFMTTGTLTADVMRAGVLQDKTGKNFFLDLLSGVLRGNFSELSITGRPAATVEEATALAEEKARAELEAYDKTMATKLGDLQNQIDGQITSWFYPYDPTPTNEPAASWVTEEERENHAGDLFYNRLTGYAYRWTYNSTAWEWVQIIDTDVVKALANAKDAQDTADSKRRTFISQPVPPYDLGDIWARGAAGELLVCATARVTEELYTSTDWVSAADYTAQAATAGRNLVGNAANIGKKNSNVIEYNGTEFTCTPTETSMADGDWNLTEYGTKAMPGKYIVLSYEYKTLQAITWADNTAAGMQGRVYINFEDGTAQTLYAPTDWRSLNTAVMNAYEKVERKMKVTNKPIASARAVVFIQCASGKVSFRNVKVEIGEKSTPWTAAPEDAAITVSPADVLTQEQVFNLLTKNGTMQGIYMKDDKLYINAQYIATGKIASADGEDYFDLETGSCNFKGVFTSKSGHYSAVFRNAGFVLLYDDVEVGSLHTDVGKNSFAALSKYYLGAFSNNPQPFAYLSDGNRAIECEILNGNRVSWQWNDDMQKWVLAAN